MGTKTVNWSPFYRVYMAMRSKTFKPDELGNLQVFYTPVPYLDAGDIANVVDNCAMRMSAALIMSGHDLSDYKGSNVTSTDEPKVSSTQKPAYYKGELWLHDKKGNPIPVHPTSNYTPVDIEPKDLGLSDYTGVQDFNPHKQKLIRGAQDLFLYLEKKYYTSGRAITYAKINISKEVPAIYCMGETTKNFEIKSTRISAGLSPVAGRFVPISQKEEYEKLFNISIDVKQKTDTENGDTQIFVGGFLRFVKEKKSAGKGIVFYENFHIDIIDANYFLQQGREHFFPTEQFYTTRPNKIMILDY